MATTSRSHHHSTAASVNIQPPAPPPPNFLASVKLKYVKLGYHYLMHHYLTLSLLPLIAITTVHTSQLSLNNIETLYIHLHYNLIAVVLLSAAAVISSTVYFMSRPKPVYLIDYSCYKPHDNLKINFDGFNESALEFQRKIYERSGLGEETYLPPAIHSVPPVPSMSAAREEAEQVMFGSLDNLFKSTNVNPKDIAILVVNCSLFNPIPSLSSMIVNKYKLRGNIKTFNLGGMGCSAEVIAVDLAKDMLQAHRNSYAVVVSTENITQNWYSGNNKSMLIPNCLFRVGCASILLSNRSIDKQCAKYKLRHIVLTHRGSDDTAFNCAYQEEDESGKIGVALSKDLIAISGGALKANITSLGPLVLPISERLLFFGSLMARRVLDSKMKPYIPDFKLAFDHFCIHACGKAVIDELKMNLALSEEHVEPSRMTLYRFGNTSSSSIWYELAYTEAKGRMKKGNRVWQIAFGSGFMCNSAVWEAIRDVKASESNPWADCIHKFPVEINA